MIVLSHYQARSLLSARQQNHMTANASPDLGRSMVFVELSAAGATFPTGETITWVDLQRIADHEQQCFQIAADTVAPIMIFSEATNWLRSLYPTPGAPTTIVAGFPMHRIQGIDPWHDTELKLATIAPIIGQVLDTATGLGCTAIAAARTAEHVITVERDPAALAIARLNPWSRELFDQAHITLQSGDVAEIIRAYADGQFMRIIHDPPTLKLAGDLYGLAFYRELYRVLSARGRLFHYIGDITAGSGQRTAAGVIRRLGAAGFRQVIRRPEAFGVVGVK